VGALGGQPPRATLPLLWLMAVVGVACVVTPLAYYWVWERFWPGSYYVEMDRRLIRQMIDDAEREHSFLPSSR
jgi:hypothetical protein